MYGGFEEFGLITYRDCPHLMTNKITMNIIKLDYEIHGKDDAFVQSMHEGKFSAIGANMVFNMERVALAMSGLLPSMGRDREIALDFSGGGDESVMTLRVGNSAKIIKTWHERDATRLADYIDMELKRLRWRKDEPIKGDNGGLGSPINDILERRLPDGRMGWTVERFDFGGASPEAGYLNKRAYAYFNLAKHVALGHVVFQNDEKLKEQLGWQKYTADDNRKRKIIPKEKMPSSPDRADTYMMVFCDWIMPEIRDAIEDTEKLSPCGSVNHSPTSDDCDPWNQEGVLYG